MIWYKAEPGDKNIMDKIVENYVTTNEIKQLEEQMSNTEALKKLLEEYFKFEIPYYVALDIALSQGNAATLKQGIKELFNVKNKYDNVESKILINKF